MKNFEKWLNENVGFMMFWFIVFQIVRFVWEVLI